VFDYMERAGEHMQFMIQVQFLEIYNEKIRDLLSPDKVFIHPLTDKHKETQKKKKNTKEKIQKELNAKEKIFNLLSLDNVGFR